MARQPGPESAFKAQARRRSPRIMPLSCWNSMAVACSRWVGSKPGEPSWMDGGGVGGEFCCVLCCGLPYGPGSPAFAPHVWIRTVGVCSNRSASDKIVSLLQGVGSRKRSPSSVSNNRGYCGRAVVAADDRARMNDDRPTDQESL